VHIVQGGIREATLSFLAETRGIRRSHESDNCVGGCWMSGCLAGDFRSLGSLGSWGSNAASGSVDERKQETCPEAIGGALSQAESGRTPGDISYCTLVVVVVFRLAPGSSVDSVDTGGAPANRPQPELPSLSSEELLAAAKVGLDGASLFIRDATSVLLLLRSTRTSMAEQGLGGPWPC
jgi:hypothetical protein